MYVTVSPRWHLPRDLPNPASLDDSLVYKGGMYTDAESSVEQSFLVGGRHRSRAGLDARFCPEHDLLHCVCSFYGSQYLDRRCRLKGLLNFFYTSCIKMIHVSMIYS